MTAADAVSAAAGIQEWNGIEPALAKAPTAIKRNPMTAAGSRKGIGADGVMSIQPYCAATSAIPSSSEQSARPTTTRALTATFLLPGRPASRRP